MTTADVTPADIHPIDCDGDCCRPWYERNEAGLHAHDHIGFMMLLGFGLGITAIELCALLFHTPHFTVVLGALP